MYLLPNTLRTCFELFAGLFRFLIMFWWLVVIVAIKSTTDLETARATFGVPVAQGI
jgi:hypothetical protein